MQGLDRKIHKFILFVEWFCNLIAFGNFVLTFWSTQHRWLRTWHVLHTPGLGGHRVQRHPARHRVVGERLELTRDVWPVLKAKTRETRSTRKYVMQKKRNSFPSFQLQSRNACLLHTRKPCNAKFFAPPLAINTFWTTPIKSGGSGKVAKRWTP